MYSRKIEKFFPKPVIIPAYILAVAGIGVIFYDWIIAIFIIALALFIITGYEGIMIDKENSRLKIYYSIFFLKFGSWEPIPKFSRLLLVPEQLKYKGNIFSKNAITENKFGVRLYYADSSDYILAAKDELESIKKDAEFLSKMLNLKIEDHSDVDIEEILKMQQNPPQE